MSNRQGCGVVRSLQKSMGAKLRERVAGPDGAQRTKEIWGAEGERWFVPGDPIWWINDDASTFIGGITALLTQMLHPGAMAGVGDFSGYKQDPWGRLQRTADYIAVTSFGTIADAKASIARVKRIHDRVRGVDAIGNPYWGSDPDLLLFVHAAEIDSFLRAYLAYGKRNVTRAEADTYVAQSAIPARLLGVERPPLSVAELHAVLRNFRKDLVVTDSAREAADFVLHNPPIDGAGRLAFGMLTSGAVALLPGFAREMLDLGVSARRARYVYRPVGKVATAGIRWALGGIDKVDRLPPDFAREHLDDLLRI